MMVLFLTGELLTSRTELGIAGTLAAVLVSISVRDRRDKNWRWKRPRALKWLATVGGLLLTAFFAFSAAPLFPPSNHRFLPWYLACAGIGAFGALNGLQLVTVSKEDFQKQCLPVEFSGENASEPRLGERETPVDDAWKRRLRAAFTIFFFLIWIDGVASFYFFGIAFRHGTQAPTAANSEPLQDHGHVVFVPKNEKQMVERLQNGMMFGIPLVVVFGFVIHFLLGVKLVPNAPTLNEWRASRAR
jgi:hypothetical protein